MGMMDGIKDKMGGMSDDMKSRYEELKAKEQMGTLDDKAKEELSMLRGKFERKD